MRLTELDKNILYELDSDSRKKLSLLAKKFNTSEQRIKYRLNLLLKNKIICRFISFINITRLGYIPFRVFIQYRNVNPQKEKEIVEFLVRSPHTQWIGSFSGRWDLEIVIFARNFFHYLSIMSDITRKYGANIQAKTLSVAIDNYYFKRRYLSKKNKKIDFTGVSHYGGEPRTYSIDEKDIKILEMLSTNARSSLVEIAAKINATPNCAKDRIRRLKTKGILQEHTLLLDIKQMGYEFYKILINLRKFDKEIESKIVSFCDKFPNIWFFIMCEGEWNVEFEVEVKGNKDVRKILREFRNEFKDLVISYETMLVYSIDKMSYFPQDLKNNIENKQKTLTGLD